MERIAEVGYAGVEPIFKLPGTTAETAAQLFRRLGLEVPSAHVPLPLGPDRDPVLDTMAAFGSTRIVSGKGPEGFETMELVRHTCGLFNEANAVAVEQGMRFGIHNHWWEFERVEGRLVYRVMLELLDPAIFFEVDTYWVRTAGLDPTTVVEELGSRAELLHIKDGPALEGEPQVAVGQGVLDIRSIILASGGAAEWLVAELDDCATDMLDAVEQSYRYLVEEGLAYGRQG
jgi:sugar phosphate isomerase/epimerase